MLGHAANLALARRPRFVILATARAGTTFVARYLTELDIRCGHESYYTPSGPLFFNPNRRFGTRGDASWMAVPYAAGKRMVCLHQVRHPLAVVRSLIKFGLFDLRLRERHLPYLRFLERHFEIGPDPLDTSIRWYLEWNDRAGEAAAFRYQVEEIDAALPEILRLIGERPKRAAANVPRNLNWQPPAFRGWDDGLDERIRAHPRFEELAERGRSYGYSC